MPRALGHQGAEPLPDKRQYQSARRKEADMEYVLADLDVPATISQVENFHPVHTVDIRGYQYAGGYQDLETFIRGWVVRGGRPLVITDLHRLGTYPRHIFSPEWLAANHARDLITPRDLSGRKAGNDTETQMSMGHYLKNLPKLAANVIDESNPSPQRLYGKDIDCPAIWREKLREIIPSFLFYLEPSADLMSMLPPGKRAENIMCYFGHEGTYTPAHKEMCGTLGHNLMVHTSKGYAPGSSIWWMTDTKDRKLVANFWLELGHDIEIETHFTGFSDWMDAPFPVYIHEQKEGDFILVPPMAPHQVWNRGECTLKAAWNRVTVESLEFALGESLAKSRMVCRDEQYKSKAIVHETLRKYARILNGESSDPKLRRSVRMEGDFGRLFKLFDRMMLSECFAPDKCDPAIEILHSTGDDSISCSFCRSDIWNRFLTCKTCVIKQEGEIDDMYDICLDCYARGRSCWCVSGMHWVEHHRWSSLISEHEKFRRILLQIRGAGDHDSLRPLHEGLQNLGRKSLAWVCQEQLEIRPWIDVEKNGLEDEENADGDLADLKKKQGRTSNCHACKVQHDAWKMAKCTKCAKTYCFGNLWRAYDMDPFEEVLSQFDWTCPVCRNFCNCGACRKKGITVPYQQVGTYLANSTKPFSDERSIEVLVAFDKGNVIWTTGSRKRKVDSQSLPPNIPVDPALGDPGVNLPGMSPATTESGEGYTSNTLSAIQTTVARGPTEGEGKAGHLGGGRRVCEVASESTRYILNDTLSSTFGHLNQYPGRWGNDMADSGSTLLQSYQHNHRSPPPGTIGNTDLFSSAQTLSLGNSGSRHQHQGLEQSTRLANSDTLTALESNPLAFIAAAGLMKLPSGGSDHASLPTRQDVSASVPTTVAPHQLYNQTPHVPDVQLHSTSSTPSPTPGKPRIQFPRRPRVPIYPTSTDRELVADCEEQIGDWVRKTHAANQWTKNLKRRRMCLVIKLKLPKDRFREIMKDIYARDIVVSDLVRTGPGQPAVFLPPARIIGMPIAESKAGPSRRKRGRPKKSETVANLSEGEDENDFDVRDNGAVVAEKQRSMQRRREAYLRRKKEEDEARARFLAFQKQQELQKLHRRESNADGSARRSRNRFLNKEILDVMRHQDELHIEPETEEEKRARETRENEASIAREAKADEDRARRAAEAEAEHVRRDAEAEAVRVRLQEESAARRAVELERHRIRVEENAARKAERKVERAKFRAAEKGRRRKEADRQAKLAAIGAISYDDIKEYLSSSNEEDDSSDESELEMPDYMDGNDNLESLQNFVPRDWPLAVIIDLPSFAGWREMYERFPEPDPALIALPGSTSTNTVPGKRGRGRPRKHPLGYIPKSNQSSRRTRGSKPGSNEKYVDRPFKPDYTVRTTASVLPSMNQRGRRKSAAVAAAGIKNSLESENDRERKTKKVIRKRIEVKPGLWGFIEITDSEGESDEEDGNESDIADYADQPMRQPHSEPSPEPEMLDQEAVELDLIGLTPEEAHAYIERSRRQSWF